MGRRDAGAHQFLFQNGSSGRPRNPHRLMGSSPLAASLSNAYRRRQTRIATVGQAAARNEKASPTQAVRPRTLRGAVLPHLNLALFSRVLAQPQPDWPVQTVVTGAVQYDAV